MSYYVASPGSIYTVVDSTTDESSLYTGYELSDASGLAYNVPYQITIEPGIPSVDPSQPPYSCMDELFVKYYDDRSAITSEQKQAAYDAWVTTTGSPSPTAGFRTLLQQRADTTPSVFYYNSYYFLVPVTIFLSIILWIFTKEDDISWQAEYFFYLTAIFILYTAGIVYRVMAQNIYNSTNAKIFATLDMIDTQYVDSIAVMPFALYDSACAVIST
jgi:hypothetical protein